VIRKVFLFDLPTVFPVPSNECFEIFDAISSRFNVPLSGVKAVGSAQTGYSYFKKRSFDAGTSDFDVAIVSASLFTAYIEISVRVTDSYRDLTKFKNAERLEQFKGSLALGFFRPDLMPNCREREEWFRFFNRLSQPYSQLFKSINAGVYVSEVALELKQRAFLEEFRRARQK
jgi:hypothetical protein